MVPLACLFVGASLGLTVWVLVDVINCPRIVNQEQGRFEVERRTKLRNSNRTYRLFEPLVDEWGELMKHKEETVIKTEEALVAGGIREPWKAEEFLNVKRLEGILIGIAVFGIAVMILGFSMFGAVLTALAAGWGYQWLTLRTLKSQAIVRQVKMKRRFASAIDLMALMMEVGAGFQECLDVAAREAHGTALGEELSLVQKEISMGSLRSTALKGLADRTRDADMIEVIMSINEGEELGTPLTSILRNQADQMRQKRSQWAEKAAEESQVAIVFPAMLIMIACLLVVVAPFVLTVISGN